jgi:hypothetical protein
MIQIDRGGGGWQYQLVNISQIGKAPDGNSLKIEEIGGDRTFSSPFARGKIGKRFPFLLCETPVSPVVKG